jgi:predicted nucleotidyltransferase component of viral defense system
VRDAGASILAKLKNRAKTGNTSYQQILQLFFQEEFLRRLARSGYVDNLILKGGLFIYTLTNFTSRATIDIDFLLRRIDNSLENMDAVIAEIVKIPTDLSAAVTFRVQKAEPIAIQRKYRGVSVQITGFLKNVRVPFTVDIGTGDVIVPGAEKRIIQTQLLGYEPPEIYTYSLESTIAEKFDAILQRFELTSRMKDFYDINYLAHAFTFDGSVLREAIEKTLGNRGTVLNESSLDHILHLETVTDIKTRWRYFQKTIHREGLELSSILYSIDVFLRPVCESVVSGSGFTKTWKADRQAWV